MVAKLLVSAALFAANTALSMSRKIEGPRLDDLKFTSGDYGAGLANVWGKRRLQTPIFWSEDLKEIKRRRKTKGGKYNDYTYYGTWAVALAGHEIEAVTRVWFDTHLVFDLTGAGPVTPFDFGNQEDGKRRTFFVAVANLAMGDPFAPKVDRAWVAVYAGTETQGPDPRIQATVEAKFGEGSCPAYRGTAYMVFKDVPLEKLGNRIPQVSVEFVGAGAETAVLTQNVAYMTIPTWTNAGYSADHSLLILTDHDNFEVWDMAARAPILSAPIFKEPGDGDPPSFASIGVYSSGEWLMMTDVGGKLYRFSADGGSATLLQTFGSTKKQEGVMVLRDYSGAENYITYPLGGRRYYYVNGAELYDDNSLVHCFADAYGSIWGVFAGPSVSAIDTVKFKRLKNSGDLVEWGGEFTLSGVVPELNPAVFASHVKTTTGDHIALQWEGEIYIVDPVALTATLGTDDIGTINLGGRRFVWDSLIPGANSIWFDGVEVSLVTGEILRTVSGIGSGSAPTFYDALNHAIVQDGAYDDATLTFFYLDRVSGNGVTLQSVVESVCSRAGIDAGQVVASALDQTIDGYSATSGSGKEWLEPLLDLHDSDARPHGFSLEFVKRGGAAGGTLTQSGFARIDGQAEYSASRGGPTDVPARVTLNFADVAADQQPNAAPSGPLAGATGKAETTLDMSTLAIGVDAARQLVGRYHRRALFDRTEYTLSLPASQGSLEPGDVRYLQLATGTALARLSSLVLTADRQIEARWKRDDPAVAVLSGQAGAAFDGRNPAVIIVPLVSKGFVLDIPLLDDADSVSTPVVYLAAAPYATGAWPGASFFQAIDGEYSEEISSVASSSQVGWGYATDVLADANPNLWDRGNAVNVKLQVGALSGTTESTIDAAPSTNLALIGNELVNFTTATLEGDGSYTLSGFKRGRRGTEWATASHAARDVFLLLDTAETEAMGLSEVGTDLSFKAITSGRSESSAFPINLSFTGASLKPYAPCHLAAALNGSDWDLSWVRRTRVGGAWTSGTSIPLSEASEEYEIEIMDGATVKRTVTGLTSPAYTYASADQTTDFGAPLTSAPSFRVYQISDAVGRGFVATA